MLGKRTGFLTEQNKVQVLFEEGKVIVEVLTENIMNVLVPLREEDHRSKAIEGNKTAETEVAVKDEGEYLSIATKVLEARVFDGGYIDFYQNGVLLCADYRGERKVRAIASEKMIELAMAEGHAVPAGMMGCFPVQVVKTMDGDEKFYGLGDKTGFLNKRDYEFENWNSDIPQAHTEGFKALYKSIPFLITLKDAGVYGIFFDNTFRSSVNLGKESQSYYFYGADGGNLDYYFIAGADMPQVVEGYTYLTGTTPLPQFWTLGYHQSRWGYDSAECMRDVAKHMRDLQIPCDTIHFDIDYMDGYRVFTWDEEDYGEPGAIVKELKENGFKTVCIIDPGVKLDPGYTKYDEGIANDYFAKTPEGEVYVNAVWPGDAVYPDFGNPKVRAWWADNQKYLMDLGIAGVWNDMNEPASFKGELPKDVVFTDEDRPCTHAEMHNIYGHLMSKATYEGVKKYSGKRPFVITRACYAGSQKYTTVWTGDNQSLWAHIQMAIPQLCNLGMSGIAFAGTDVGGFGFDCTPELMTRWVQVGAFSPLFRNHSCNGTQYQEPWQYGEETVRIYRKFVELRYRLLPYFYDLFHECEKTGLPVMRPLVLHYEHDKNTWNLNDEFLIGENLLVAPVVEQGAVKRMVYLPEGIWYDFHTGEKYEGGKYYLVDAPLDTCPVFAKAGSMIPTYEVQQYTDEKPYDRLNVLVFPGEGEYTHYQDNGTDFAYRDGAYNLYHFVNHDGKVEMDMVHEGYERRYEEITYTEI